MKVNQRILKEAVEPLLSIVPQKRLLEYMDYFLLKTTDKGLIVTYSMSEATISVKIEEGYEGEINACIHILFLQALTNADVDMDLDVRDNRCFVTFKGGKFEVPITDRDHYFTVNTDGIYKTCEVSGESFVNSVKHMTGFCNKDRDDQWYGVKFMVSDRIKAAAFSGPTMAFGVVEGEAIKGCVFNFPQIYVNTVAMIASDTIKISDSNRNVHFLSGNYSASFVKNTKCLKIENFFKLEEEKLQPDETYRTLHVVDVKHALEQLKKSNLFNEKISSLIEITFGEGEAFFKTVDTMNNYSASFSFETVFDKGECEEVLLKYDDLVRVLSSLKEPVAEFLVCTESAQVMRPVIVNEGTNKFILNPFGR